MLLRTIAYLIEKDGVDSRVTRLLNTTDIFFLPSMNPDGFVKAQVLLKFTSKNVKQVRQVRVYHMDLRMCHFNSVSAEPQTN